MNASFMQSWLSICAKFEALNKRERWLVFAALLFVVYSLLNALLLSPVLTKNKTLSTQISGDQTQLQALQQQIASMNSQPVFDPDAANKQRILDLTAELKTLDSQLNEMRTTLISPEQIPELLRSILKKNGKLKLLSLKTLPAESMVKISAPASGTQNTVTPATSDASNQELIAAAGFKHGVEISIEGRYLDLLQYVTELEKTPWHILWSKAELSTENYPLSQLKLTVYTLSVNPTWLSI